MLENKVSNPDSKQLKDFVVAEDFIVRQVISKNYSKLFTPLSEIIVGGRSPSYETGYSSELKIKVDSIEGKCPVKILNFYGYSIVRAGDKITAKIPRYKQMKENRFNHSFLHSFNNQTFYFDREFNLEESVIEIIIKDQLNNELRIDRSIDYQEYSKNN